MNMLVFLFSLIFSLHANEACVQVFGETLYFPKMIYNPKVETALLEVSKTETMNRPKLNGLFFKTILEAKHGEVIDAYNIFNGSKEHASALINLMLVRPDLTFRISVDRKIYESSPSAFDFGVKLSTKIDLRVVETEPLAFISTSLGPTIVASSRTKQNTLQYQVGRLSDASSQLIKDLHTNHFEALTPLLPASASRGYTDHASLQFMDSLTQSYFINHGLSRIRASEHSPTYVLSQYERLANKLLSQK